MDVKEITWTGFMWLRIETAVGNHEDVNKLSVSIKYRTFDQLTYH
jgi:hypothetical protein